VSGLRLHGDRIHACTHLPLVALGLGAGDLVLEVLLRLLGALELALELLLELLARVVEVVELVARVREHVRDLEVLCAPVHRRGRVAARGRARERAITRGHRGGARTRRRRRRGRTWSRPGAARARPSSSSTRRALQQIGHPEEKQSPCGQQQAEPISHRSGALASRRAACDRGRDRTWALVYMYATTGSQALRTCAFLSAPSLGNASPAMRRAPLLRLVGD
jgi:hypothetical protein